MKPLKAKIKVVDMKSSDEVKDKYQFPGYFKTGFCDKFQIGQEFVVDFDPELPMPEGFPCKYAWDSLLIYHPFILRHIKIQGVEDDLTKYDHEIACCVDGLKPVTFELSLLNRDEEEMEEKD